MSTKIIKAVNSMVSNADKITDVFAGDGEIFFRYDKKYTWGISENDAEYFLYFYPEAQSPEELSSLDLGAFESMFFVSYSTTEYGTREARATFKELHQVVKEKVYGMDKVLDDIINDDMPF